MPKIIHNKKQILKIYEDRHKYNLNITQVSEIFEVDPKTIYNYRHKSDEWLESVKINRVSFMNQLSDDIMTFIINEAINNIYFNTNLIRCYSNGHIFYHNTYILC